MNKKTRFSQALLTFLSLALLLSVGLIKVSAASNMYDSNVNNAKEAVKILEEEKDVYRTKAIQNDYSTEIAQKVNTLINSYSLTITNMPETEPDQTVDLSDDIAAEREKAIHVSKLAWIIYAHYEKDICKENANEETLLNDKVYMEFLKYKKEIDATASEAAVKAKINDNCNALLKFVFQENLDILRTSGTEDYGIKQRINADELSINALVAYDIDALEYYAIYNETLHFVTVRRAYADADRELKQVISALGVSSQSQPVKDFIDGMTALNSIDDVNNALGTAVSALIALRIPESEGFIGNFKNKLLTDCSNKVNEACDKETDEYGNTLIADLSAVFENIDLKEYCARKKDEVDALVPRLERDSVQRNIIKSYTDDNGFLDNCNDKTSLDFEAQRARLRINLYDNYTLKYKSIETDLDETGNTTILQNAASIYTTADSKIVGIDRNYTYAKEQCDTLYEEANTDLDELVHQAKALKYLHKHNNILNEETPQTITVGDRGTLETAISDYTALTPETQEYLKDTKKDLNAKYKALTVIEIKNNADPQSDDTQALISATEALSVDLAPSELKALADDNVLRATALGTLQNKYDEITSDSQYGEYDTDTKNALSNDYTDASNKILGSVATNDQTLAEALNAINAESDLNMEKHAAIGKIRLAANGCELDDVKATVTQAEADILADENANDVHATRDTAIFRIESQKQAAEMRKAIASLKDKIDSLPALDSNAKASLKGEADALLSDCNDAANANDRNALNSIVSEFTDKLSDLEAKAENDALLEGKRQAIEAVNNAASSAKEKIDGYGFIDYENKETSTTLKDDIDGISSNFEAAANDASVGWDELNNLKSTALENIEKAVSDADSAERSGAKESVKDSINGAFATPEHYSDTNKSKIEDIIDDAADDLEHAVSVSELIAIRDETLAKIAKIPTLLDEAKLASLAKLERVYVSLKEDIHCYSETVWSEIQEIYDHTVAELDLLSKFEELLKATSLADERCTLMQSKKRDKVYTDDGLLASSSTAYPNGYDTIRNGYAGSLTANENIPFDATFSVFPFSNPNAQELIRKAVKDKLVILPEGQAYNKQIVRKLRGCNVLSALDIAYSASSNGINGTYTVTLILPNGFDTEDLLGAVYIRSDGSIEFFECSVRGNTVTFDVPHFSSFYLVSEKTVNLMPLIITLSILLLAEAVAIAILVIRRIKRTKAVAVASVMPILPFTVLTKLIPAGALPLSIVLGVLVLCAGGTIAWLVINELKNKAPVKEKETEEVPEPLPEPIPVPAIAEPEPVPVPAIAEPEPTPVLDTVSVDEANDLMSDADAQAAIESITPEELPPAVYSSHGKKYEVNIDVISSAFSAEETVSLDSLKEKGLVPKSAKAVKVLARGTLDKPLTVIAQDFSTAAVKMITLTGGHAILVDRE